MAEKTGISGGGFLEGITTLVTKLAELAEKGEQLQRSGEFGASDKGHRGVYGFNVRIGGGAPGQPSGIPRVEPFGNIRQDHQTGKAVVHPIREPLVDVFEEGPDVLVVAELPGVDRKDITLELREDILTLHAEHEALKYHKEVLLPRRFTRRQMHTSCRNGVLEIRLTAQEESHS
ncbi:archaeal heat shock protein Hsp20 [Myxococcus sp. NMCA1]|uniref:archaeal heat shock protein Hsp20 n=1 Tax=Myxococcus sp. NMCA1 TaxID=2996785 RepID=UPI002286C74E|nr:archaeal heat shock protein Hsp20 [Myxococcus sp. NMCA1]WAM28239.1 Hsp20/alpha crystallin family protein [Myxococcus sp. NMCA1]